MATVKGTWRFNDVLTYPFDISVEHEEIFYATFTSPAFSDQLTAFCFSYDSNDSNARFSYAKDPSVASYVVFNYETGKWRDGGQTITFTEEQEVAEDFYAWLTTNATQVVGAMFKKLYSGVAVARNGTAVFRKLTTEKPATIAKQFSYGDIYDATYKYYMTQLTLTEKAVNFKENSTVLTYNLILYSGNVRVSQWRTGARIILNGKEYVHRDGNDYDNQLSIQEYSSRTLCSGEITVPHDADGTCTLDVAFEVYHPKTASYTPGDFTYTGGSMALTPIPRLNAGLYDANDNLVASWNTLVNTYGMDVEKNYTADTYNTDPESPYCVLTNNSELSAGKKIVIADGITSIGAAALRGCSNLTSIIIPDSVTSIGSSAFYGCTGFTDIAIPNGINRIPGAMFYECTSLVSITIPDGVTSIGVSAFRGCTNLKSIIIPDSLTEIIDHAFGICPSLADVYYKGTKSQWDAITIGNGNTYLTNATIHYNYKG